MKQLQAHLILIMVSTAITAIVTITAIPKTSFVPATSKIAEKKR